MGKSWLSMYNYVLDLQSVFPSLLRICLMLNLETDYGHLEIGKAWGEQVNNEATPMLELIDFEPMLSSFGSVQVGPWSVRLDRGSLVAFKGGQRSGRSLILQALSLQLAGNRADGLRVHPNVRILYVAPDPIF